MITRRSAFSALALAGALFLTPQAVFAQSRNEHLDKSIEELEEAIRDGRRHLFSSFAEHAHNAYDHAHAASGEDRGGHIKRAKTYLRQALKTARRTHQASRLARGVRQAEQALAQLKVANAGG